MLSQEGAIFLPCEGALFDRDGWGDGNSRRSFSFLCFVFFLFFKDLDHVIGDGKAAAHSTHTLWQEAWVQAWKAVIGRQFESYRAARIARFSECK